MRVYASGGSIIVADDTGAILSDNPGTLCTLVRPRGTNSFKIVVNGDDGSSGYQLFEWQDHTTVFDATGASVAANAADLQAYLLGEISAATSSGGGGAPTQAQVDAAIAGNPNIASDADIAALQAQVNDKADTAAVNTALADKTDNVALNTEEFLISMTPLANGSLDCDFKNPITDVITTVNVPIEFHGVLLYPAQSTFAGLATTKRQDGSDPMSGDLALLNQDEIGTGDAANPQYPHGWYFTDGAGGFSLHSRISDNAVIDLSDYYTKAEIDTAQGLQDTAIGLKADQAALTQEITDRGAADTAQDAQIALRELLSNKVTTIGTPGNDTNYPSEKAVRDLVESLSFTGDYQGSAATVAALPNPTSANGNWAILTAVDGANQPGIYVTNGTAYSLAREIQDITQLADSTLPDTDANYNTPGTVSVENLDDWGRSRRVRRIFNTSTNFDFASLPYADRTAVYVRNTNPNAGINIVYGTGGANTLNSTDSSGFSAVVAGQNDFNLQPLEIAVLEKDGTNVYVSISPGERVSYFDDYADANTSAPVAHDAIVVIRSTGEIFGRATNTDGIAFPADGQANTDWFKVSGGEVFTIREYRGDPVPAGGIAAVTDNLIAQVRPGEAILEGDYFVWAGAGTVDGITVSNGDVWYSRRDNPNQESHFRKNKAGGDVASSPEVEAGVDPLKRIVPLTYALDQERRRRLYIGQQIEIQDAGTDAYLQTLTGKGVIDQANPEKFYLITTGINNGPVYYDPGSETAFTRVHVPRDAARGGEEGYGYIVKGANNILWGRKLGVAGDGSQDVWEAINPNEVVFHADGTTAFEWGKLNIYPQGTDLDAVPSPSIKANSEALIGTLDVAGTGYVLYRHYVGNAAGDAILNRSGDEVTSTYTGIQRIGKYTPASPVGISNGAFTSIATAINLDNAEILEIDISDGANGHIQSVRVPVDKITLGVDNGGLFHWYDNVYIRLRIDDAAAKTAGNIRLFVVNGSGQRVHEVRAYADAANGFVIPTGTQLATPRTLTVTSPTPTPDITIVEEQAARLFVNVSPGKQLVLGAVSDANLVLVSPIDGLITAQATGPNPTVTFTEIDAVVNEGDIVFSDVFNGVVNGGPVYKSFTPQYAGNYDIVINCSYQTVSNYGMDVGTSSGASDIFAGSGDRLVSGPKKYTVTLPAQEVFITLWGGGSAPSRNIDCRVVRR